MTTCDLRLAIKDLPVHSAGEQTLCAAIDRLVGGSARTLLHAGQVVVLRRDTRSAQVVQGENEENCNLVQANAGS